MCYICTLQEQSVCYVSIRVLQITNPLTKGKKNEQPNQLLWFMSKSPANCANHELA